MVSIDHHRPPTPFLGTPWRGVRMHHKPALFSSLHWPGAGAQARTAGDLPWPMATLVW